MPSQKIYTHDGTRIIKLVYMEQNLVDLRDYESVKVFAESVGSLE